MATDQNRVRLDLLLTGRKLYATRSRARDAVLRSCVSVDGTTISRPGALISPSATIKVMDEGISHVLRAALKLKHGLHISGFTPRDKICLDLGASTGGFSQVLLEYGAAHIFALDAGHGQLDKRIKSDNRVIELSGLNARNLTLDHLNGERPEFLVGDLSFISLKIALPPALELAAVKAKGIFLIKPQFEVGRENLNKKRYCVQRGNWRQSRAIRLRLA